MEIMKRTRQKLQERLKTIEKHLANATEYVAKGVNVEGDSFLHFGDWTGKSGHPLWMKNHMIPTVMKARTKAEKTLENIHKKAKEKRLTLRKRRAHSDRQEEQMG
jgi:hypothetical protein